MGRAGRWLRHLWSGSKEHKDSSSSYSSEEVRTAEKKRWSFRKSRDGGEAPSAQNASTAAAIEAAWFRSFYAASEKEQSKHAIAVAAATAAAADAAVKAAEAATAAARIAGGGPGAALFGRLGEEMEVAAVKIQTAFRAYLARKALRALKALVKLQALVRGYIVRKQAAATLHSMQALVRAQATVRAQRSQNLLSDQDRNFLPEIRHRRSLERINDARNLHPSSFQTRRLSASVDGALHCRSPRTVEIDAWRGRPRSNSRRPSSSSTFDPADDDALFSGFSSPLPCQVPARLSIPSRRNFQENDWPCPGDRCRLPATAHNTPRCTALTPAKSVCLADGPFRQHYSSVTSSPSYMASTRSSMARLRSQTTTTTAASKRQPLGEINLEARANLGASIGTQKPCSQAQEPFSFRKAVIEKFDRPSEQGKEIDQAYLQRRW